MPNQELEATVGSPSVKRGQKRKIQVLSAALFLPTGLLQMSHELKKTRSRLRRIRPQARIHATKSGPQSSQDHGPPSRNNAVPTDRIRGDDFGVRAHGFGFTALWEAYSSSACQSLRLEHLLGRARLAHTQHPLLGMILHVLRCASRSPAHDASSVHDYETRARPGSARKARR